MNRKAVTNWMLWTIIGGLIFVGSQAWEWYHFIIGDSGAVETARQEILHIYNEEGERLSFSQQHGRNYSEIMKVVPNYGPLSGWDDETKQFVKLAAKIATS